MDGVELYGPGLGAGSDIVTLLLHDLSVAVDALKAGTGTLTVVKAVATTPVVLSGMPVIDGYQTVDGDLVLLTGQASPADNGLWTAFAGAWDRPADFKSGAVVTSRTVVASAGTANIGAVWALQVTVPVTVGTTAQTWLNTPVAGLAAALAGKADAAATTAALAGKQPTIPPNTYVDTTTAQSSAGAKTWTGDQRAASGRPHYDLTAFTGVDGSGATKSTAGVLNAIAAVRAAGGGVLFIPPKTTIDVDPGQIIVDQLYVSIVSQSASATLRCSSGTGAFVIRFYNAAVNTIRNLQVQVSGTAKITGSAVEIDCLLGSSMEHFEAHNIYVSNQGAQGERTARIASTTAGSNTVTIDATDPPFTSGDTGGMIAVEQAGVDTAPYVGFMTYVDATHVIITDSAGVAFNATYSKAAMTAHYFSAASAIMVNGIGIGTSKQAATQDVAETNWYTCKATRCLVAGLFIGPQLSGNVINHRAYGCEFTVCLYNIVIAGANICVYGGTLEAAKKADVKLFGAGDGPIVIDGVRSENSYRFWECINAGTSVATVSLRSCVVTHIGDPAGKAIVHQSAGSLSVRDGIYHQPTATTNVQFDIGGVDATHPLHFNATGVGIETTSLTPFGVDPQTIRDLDWYQVASDGTTRGSLTGRVMDDSLTVKGGLVVGKAKLAASATDGFAWLPTVTAPPTGVPTTKTGAAAVAVGDDGTVWLYSPAASAWVALGTSSGGGAPGEGVYGDGSDGNVTISGTTTLTRDMYYDTLTIASGGSLVTAGYRVYCKTLFNLQAGGTCNNSGGNAAGATGGAITTGSLGTGRGGVTATTGAGTAPSAISNGLGGAGAAGGTGSSGAGGAGGGVAAPATNLGGMRSLPQVALGHFLGNSSITATNGGGGGGSGAGDGSTGGGGGGGGGQVLVIAAKSIILAGTLRCAGGNGGIPTGGNCGGGGGGGGGIILAVYDAISGANAPLVAATHCPGGTGGAGTGTGTAGSNGSAGGVRAVVNKT